MIAQWNSTTDGTCTACRCDSTDSNGLPAEIHVEIITTPPAAADALNPHDLPAFFDNQPPPFTPPPAGWQTLRGRDRDLHRPTLPGPRRAHHGGPRPRPGRDRSRYTPTP